MATGINNSSERGSEREVQIAIGPSLLIGTLNIPTDAQGVVLFAHGSGSSRFSPRNRRVARALREGNLATLLIDLLTADEERVDNQTSQLRFNIDLLAQRLAAITDWMVDSADTRRLKIGYFGASTGAGAALVAAAMRPDSVSAVVSRGGRPDLAGSALSKVKAPVLLIVGSQDVQVVGMNRQALEQVTSEKTLEIVPGATHLFEEPGTLEQVATLARDWFKRYLGAEPPIKLSQAEW